MRSNTYRWIFALLTVSTLSILLSQAFWVRNLYLEKKEQFRVTVIAAIDLMVRKLHDREQLQIIRSQSDSLIVSRLRKFHLSGSGDTTVHIKRINKTNGTTIVLAEAGALVMRPTDSLLATFAGTVLTPDSQVAQVRRRLTAATREMIRNIQEYEPANVPQNVGMNIIKTESIIDRHDSTEGGKTFREAETDRFMERFITEVRIIDHDEKNGDTLRMLLAGVLLAKGIDAPFEFSLQNIKKGSHRVITQSGNFDSTSFSFRGDLSQHRIVKTNNFLFLQFPDEDAILFSNMKGSLFVSSLFVGLMLFVFYKTMQLVWRQKKISEIRNDFVNNITHELKTPIATIGLAIDAMNHPRVKNDSDKLHEYSAILKEENNKLNRHVERVLQVSLLEKGLLSTRKEEVSINRLIDHVAGSFRLQAAAQRATVTAIHESGDLHVYGDEEQLAAMISNLVDNALKYAGDGCSVIVRSVRRQGITEIMVEDDGPGIPSAEKEKVFEKFYRITTEARHDTKGFGLGLSYVKTVAEQHGATVKIADREKGVAFIIIFPENEKAAAG